MSESQLPNTGDDPTPDVPEGSAPPPKKPGVREGVAPPPRNTASRGMEASPPPPPGNGKRT